MNKSEPDWGRVAGLARRLSRFDRILLLTHVNPDGDALGSLLGLGTGLQSLGKTVTMYNRDGVPEQYSFLPGAEQVVTSLGRADEYDAVVMLDCHNLSRAGDDAESMAGANFLGALDHHVNHDEPGTDFVIDARAAATGEMVYHFLRALDVEITRDIALNLFVALTTDTGSFSFDNTTPGALVTAADLVRAGAAPWDVFSHLYMARSRGRLDLLGAALSNVEFFYQGRIGVLTVTAEMMAAAGADGVDADGFVEYPRSVKGVELAAFFREDGPGTYKVSLRSRGLVNAAELARSFGGGGHERAAGLTVYGTLAEAKNKVITAAAKYLPADGEGAA